MYVNKWLTQKPFFLLVSNNLSNGCQKEKTHQCLLLFYTITLLGPPWTFWHDVNVKFKMIYLHTHLPMYSRGVFHLIGQFWSHLSLTQKDWSASTAIHLTCHSQTSGVTKLRWKCFLKPMSVYFFSSYCDMQNTTFFIFHYFGQLDDWGKTQNKTSPDRNKNCLIKLCSLWSSQSFSGWRNPQKFPI